MSKALEGLPPEAEADMIAAIAEVKRFARRIAKRMMRFQRRFGDGNPKHIEALQAGDALYECVRSDLLIEMRAAFHAERMNAYHGKPKRKKGRP